MRWVSNAARVSLHDSGEMGANAGCRELPRSSFAGAAFVGARADPFVYSRHRNRHSMLEYRHM